MNLIHIGTQLIETDRLILRPFVEKDATDMFENWINDKEIQFNYGEPIFGNIELVKTLLAKWILLYTQNDFYRWAIVLKENSENIGQIAFCDLNQANHYADIEYCISQFYQKNGYATEALKAIITFSFEKIGLNRLQAFHRGKNIVSGRVLQKAGMEFEGTFRQASFHNNEYDDRNYYAILREDYFEK